MREFSTQITQALVNGLRPEPVIGDSAYFNDLYNLVPHENACRGYQEVFDVLELAHQDQLYPFPQWFRFQNANLVVTNKDIYSADDSYYPFDLSDVQVLDRGLDIFTEPFQAVDYEDNWMLVNRDGVIYQYNGEVFTSKAIQAAAFLKHKNRTLIGGPVNGFWSDEWLRYLQATVDKGGVAGDKYQLPLKPNHVFWSSFDSYDFPFGLIDPSILLDTSDGRSLFMEALYSNEFGYMEMPFKGAVLDMVSALGQVFVFGEDGVVSIDQLAEGPGSTYRITGQQPFGIKSRGAAGGDEDSLAFIDRFDNLWYVTNQGMQKLDYSEYMKRLTGQIYVRKDPTEERFYIGDQNHSFVLNRGKLARCFQTVTSISGAYGTRLGVTYQTGDRKARIRTEKTDLGIPYLKTLTGVAIASESHITGVVQPESEINGRRVTGHKALLNPEGYAASRIFGKGQVVNIELDSFENLSIERIELKWQTDDKRQTRGVFATEGTTGTGQ